MKFYFASSSFISKVSDKMAYANSADPEQSDTLIAIPLSILFKKQMLKKHNLGQKIWNNVFEILGHLQ